MNLKLTIILLTVLQTPGPFFSRDPEVELLQPLLVAVKILGFLLIIYGLLRGLEFMLSGLSVFSVSPTAPAVTPSLVTTAHPAIASCGYCKARFTRNKVTASGSCPNCGGAVEQ